MGASRRGAAAKSSSKFAQLVVTGVGACLAIAALPKAFVNPSVPTQQSAGRQDFALRAAAKDEVVEKFMKSSVVDEAAMVVDSNFPFSPEELIYKAKEFLAYGNGLEKPALLSEDFEFAGPVVGPLPKANYLKALGSFELDSAFPDANPEFHHFRVDPFEPRRVWTTARGYGTNTQKADNPLLTSPTGKKYVNPPQACSIRFNEEGMVDQYTIGYVMDRRIGNTGGLGGIYGILYAIGKPLPFPEARPWRKSWQYAAFQKVGNLLSKLQR